MNRPRFRRASRPSLHGPLAALLAAGLCLSCAGVGPVTTTISQANSPTGAAGGAPVTAPVPTPAVANPEPAVPNAVPVVQAPSDQPGMYRFSDPGAYIKDFSIVKSGGAFHIFYIRGRANSTQSWEEMGNEVDFGHATSRNLRDWNIEAPVMKVRPDTWESRNVWAPHVVPYEDDFYMFYTGVNSKVAQQIGLATAQEDLLLWWRHPENPVLTPPAWTGFSESSRSEGRDPCVLVGNGKQHLYYTTSGPSPEGDTRDGVVAVADSNNLIDWHDRGPAVVTDGLPESPCVFRYGNSYYMITSAAGRGTWKSDNPVEGWKPFEMDLPENLTGFEVFRDGEAWFIAGFEPKMGGNSVWISPLRWREGPSEN